MSAPMPAPAPIPRLPGTVKRCRAARVIDGGVMATLIRAGFEFSRGPEGEWQWRWGAGEPQRATSRAECVEAAWASAGEYVHDALFAAMPYQGWFEHWSATPLAAQAALARIAFDAAGDERVQAARLFDLFGAMCEGVQLGNEGGAR